MTSYGCDKEWGMRGERSMSDYGYHSRLQAIQQAYDALQPDERILIGQMAQELREWLRKQCRSNKVGPGTCLEIIAAIGQLLNDTGPQKRRGNVRA